VADTAIEYGLRAKYFNPLFDDIGSNYIQSILSVSIKRDNLDNSSVQPDLLETWASFHQCQSKDSRDMIFGLLNLANDLKIQVDYACSPTALFCQVAKNHLPEKHNVDILRYCQRTSPQMATCETRTSSSPDADTVSATMEIEHELPSWVPNFGRDIKVPAFVDVGSDVHDFQKIPWPPKSSQILQECNTG